jgi:hypothetical protein
MQPYKRDIQWPLKSIWNTVLPAPTAFLHRLPTVAIRVLAQAIKSSKIAYSIRYFVNLPKAIPHRVEEVIRYKRWHTSD